MWKSPISFFFLRLEQIRWGWAFKKGQLKVHVYV